MTISAKAAAGFPLVVGLFLALGCAGSAPAQMALFEPSDYGKVDLPFRESTGDAARFIAAQDGAFEPIHELPEDDVIRRRARSIGRVDILIEGGRDGREMHTCTGALLPEGWVLTNHHCIPGEGDQTLLAVSIVMDYLLPGGEGATRYRLSTRPEDWHSTLDYSLVRALERPDPAFGTVSLSATEVEGGDPLIVIHHPLGRPMVMTRFRCFATPGQPEGPALRHRCDTLPGSSGALLFNRTLEAVAIHHSGGMMPEDDRSFNQATRITAILGASPVLSRLAGRPVAPAGRPAAAPPPQGAESGAERPPSGGLGPGEINDMLRGN